jgi:hypothetical protein
LVTHEDSPVRKMRCLFLAIGAAAASAHAVPYARCTVCCRFCVRFNARVVVTLPCRRRSLDALLLSQRGSQSSAMERTELQSNFGLTMVRVQHVQCRCGVVPIISLQCFFFFCVPGATPDAMVVGWLTSDMTAASTVQFGTTSGSYTNTVSTC